MDTGVMELSRLNYSKRHASGESGINVTHSKLIQHS